jgi:hypothetical protein
LARYRGFWAAVARSAGAADGTRAAEWVLCGTQPRLAGAAEPAAREVRPWTDDFSNLLDVLR